MTVTMSSTPPSTAKRVGRPQGVTTELGHMFLGWPFNEWIRYNAPDGDTATKQASAIRNLAWRKGIGVTVLSDREDETALHVLKYKKEKENNDGTQE
jgi:hypothetical protein